MCIFCVNAVYDIVLLLWPYETLEQGQNESQLLSNCLYEIAFSMLLMFLNVML